MTCLSPGKGLGKWSLATQALVRLQRDPSGTAFGGYVFCQLLSLYLDLPLNQKASLAGGGGGSLLGIA